MQLNIFLIENINSLNVIENKYNVYNQIFYGNWNVLQKLIDTDFSYQNFESINGFATGNIIYEKAKNILKNWYLCNGEDISVRKGISYGFVIEFELINKTVNILKLTFLVTQIIQK